MKSVNPANGQLIKDYEEHSPEQAARIIEKTNNAFKSWRETSFTERADKMHAAANILRENKEDLPV